MQVQLSDGLLQITVLALDIPDFAGIGFACGITRQALLARFQEILAPAIVEIGVDAFVATLLGDRTLTALAIEYDTNFLLGI